MKNKKKVIVVLGVISIVLLTLGFTYTFFNYSRNGTTENSISTDTITFLYEEINQQGSGIGITDALPVEDSTGKSGQAFNFRIISNTNSDVSIPYEITVRQKPGTDDIGGIVKLYLTKVDNNNNEEEVELSKYSDLTTVTKNNHQEKLLHSDKVPASDSEYNQRYRLRMWIDNNTKYDAVTTPAHCSDSNITEQNLCVSPAEWIPEETSYPYNNKTFAVTVNVYSTGHVQTQQDIEAATSADITSFSVNNTVLTEITEDYYEMILDNGETETTINVETTNPYTTVTVEKTDSTYTNVISMNTGIQKLSVSKKVPLQDGDNYFKITIKSEDKQTTAYKYLKITKIPVTTDSILSLLSDPSLTSGNYDFAVKNKTYPVHVIVLEGNQTITEDTEYGSESDCASGPGENEMATRMVIVKVKGDYTVNQDVTVGPVHTDYGGPKGFALYVTGTLTNNGTIENSHGAYAEGEDVHLFRNANGRYETVPKDGGLGGEGLVTSVNEARLTGTSGEDGSNRSTGGGGAGASNRGDEKGSATSGSGGQGTSYSGGTGGGGANSNASYANTVAGDGSLNGGAGGNAGARRGSSTWKTREAGGGAGNPGGYGNANNSLKEKGKGENGTGGLLVIYANTITNNGLIHANGSKGGWYEMASNAIPCMAGGSSGGGSINIFYNTSYTSSGDVTATSATEIRGGAGGTGSISIGSISTGSYVSTYKNYD